MGAVRPDLRFDCRLDTLSDTEWYLAVGGETVRIEETGRGVHADSPV